MEGLSPKRRQILDFIYIFIQERGYPPSVRDVTKGCDISSTSVAQYHLNVLHRDGHIHRDSEISRSIGLTQVQPELFMVPLVGTIAAGEPIPVPSTDTWETIPEDTLQIPQYLTSGREHIYALRVKGTSMIDALINDGDIVVMESTSTARDGETAAVWLKDRQEVTMKKIYHEQGTVRLQPANPLMQPVYCHPEDIEVQGRVIAVLRKVQ